MKIVLSLFLLLGAVWLLPIPENGPMMDGLEPSQVRLGLGVFLCIACLWMTEALPLSITALLVPVLAAVLGLGELQATLASFAHPLIFLFLGGFALAATLSAQGLDRWLSDQVSRLGKGRFLNVAIWFFAGTALLSMWMSNTATTAMLLPLALGILGQCATENPKNAYFLLLGLAYSASIGGLGTIVGSPPNGIAAKQLGIGFAEWMKFGIPAVALLLPAMVALLWFLLKPENIELDHTHRSEPEFAFTTPRRVTLLIFALTALAWMFGAPLGRLLGIDQMDAWVAVTAVVALVGSKVVSWKEIESGTEWGVLFLFGGGLALSSILGSSGTSLFMARILGGAIETWPFWLIIGAVVGFVIFLSELSSNTATAALLVPIFHSMAIEFGLPAGQLILPLALAASCAFMLPVGTPPNALVFGSRKIPQRQMMKTGFYLNLIFIGLITALSLLLF
jgi:sodium-dependent dicarboxylate transporter 2/3/5